MGFPIDPIGATRHLRSHVTQTWWQLRALSPEWRQLLDVRGPGWPQRVGARPHWLSPLDRIIGSLFGEMILR